MKKSIFVSSEDGRTYREGPNCFAEVYHKIDKVWCYTSVTNDELRASPEYQRDRASAVNSKTASFIQRPFLKGETRCTLWRKGSGEMAEYFEEDGKYWRTCWFVTNKNLSRAKVSLSKI